MKSIFDLVNDLRGLDEERQNYFLNRMTKEQKVIIVQLLKIIKERKENPDNGF